MTIQAGDQRPTGPSLEAGLLPHLGPLLLWTLLWALFFLTLLLGRERLPSSDFSGQYHAFGVFQAQEMSQGRLPLWSPGSYGGFPFAADTQAAAFYPLRWLTILLSLPWGFSFYALELEALFHLWLAGTFTYALSYNLTRNRLAGLISALAFGLGGYLTSFPLLQVTILETFSWLPLVLLLLRLGVGQKVGRSLRYLVGAGLVLGLSFLAGHPQAFLYCVYLSVAYYLFLAGRANWNWRSILGFGGVVAGTVVGIAAVSWLPAAHLTTYATRSDVSYDFISGGLPLLDYLQLLVPGTLSFWIPEYVGLTPVILALFAILGRRRFDKGKGEVLFWLIVALIAGWLALGDSGVLFQLAYRIAPGFSLFRQQERLLALVGLAFALLAGQGAALCFQLEAERRRRLLLKTGGFIVAGMVLAALILTVGSTFFRPDWPVIWIRQAALLIPIFFVLGMRQPQRRHVLFLILILGIDLFAATYEGLDREAGSPGVYWPEPAWLQDFQAELNSQPLSRIDSRNLFHANIGPIYGLEDMHGISPLKLAWLADFERLPQARRMALMGVSHILTDAPPETPSVPVAVIDEGLIPERPLQANIYRVENFLPRAWMSYQPQTVESESAAWDVLADPAFDPAAQVVLHTALPQLETIAPPEIPPVVETVRPSPSSLEISVETAAPGLLVISEWRYPGWQAVLDGQAVDLYPADYALQAVYVPAGEHLIQLRFRPLDVTVGGMLSILTLLVSAVFIFGRQPVRLQQAIPINRAPIPIPALPDIRSKLPALQLSQRPLILLIPLFLLAFFLRVYQLGLQELRAGEALSYSFTTMPFTQTGLADIYSPLQQFLFNIWVNQAGDSEFALRFLALVPAVLSLPLLFVFGRRLIGTGAGLLLVLLFSSSQSFVWLSQDVYSQYMWAVLFLLLATFLLFKVAERPTWGRWLLYSLVAALALYSHYYTIFALLAHGLYLLVMPKHRRQLRHWLLAGTGTAVLYLPWFISAISEGTSEAGQPVAQNLARYLTNAGQELTVGPAFDQPLGLFLFLGFALVAAFGWRQLKLRQRGWAALLGGWLGLTAFGIFLASFRRVAFNPFYIALAAPAWWLLVTVGLTSLWQRRHEVSQWMAAFAVIGLIAGSTFSLINYYTDPIVYGRSTGLRPLAEHIARQYQPNDIVVSNSPNPALAYYLRDSPITQVTIPGEPLSGRPAVEKALENLSQDVDRVWFLPGIDPEWDSEQVVFDWLDYHTMFEQSLTSNDQPLFAFRPSHAVDKVMIPLGTELAGKLTLAGVHVTLNGRPLSPLETIAIQPGDELTITLIWDTLAAVPEDYTIFVHLLAEDGSLIAQHDGTPLFGTRPTSTWQPGERLLDRHTIQISAETQPVNGRLVAGMYLVDESGTVIRQLFDGGQDAIWLK